MAFFVFSLRLHNNCAIVQYLAQRVCTEAKGPRMLYEMPETIRAGLTTQILIAETDYDTVQLVANLQGTVVTLTATEPTDGSAGHVFTFPSSTAYTAGTYTYAIYGVDDDLGNVPIMTGTFQMLPSLASGDPRTQSRIILDAVNAVIAGRATANQRSVRVGDKSIEYLSFDELLRLRDVYSELVAEEEAAAQGINRSAYYAEFRRP